MLNMDNITHAVGQSNLPAQVRRYLLGKQTTATKHDLKRGKLDKTKLYRVPAGRVDVFYKRIPEVAVSAAVSLLVDCSGSMCKKVGKDALGRYQSAQELAFMSAICMANALNIKGCVTEVVGFCNDDYNGALIHHPLKTYEERTFNIAKQERAMRRLDDTMCGNSDGENLTLAYRGLLTRRESRKIIVILSDGMPSSDPNALSSMNGVESTKLVIDTINKDSNVELFALGFDGFTGLNYKNPKMLRSAKDIMPTLMELIKEVL